MPRTSSSASVQSTPCGVQRPESGASLCRDALSPQGVPHLEIAGDSPHWVGDVDVAACGVQQPENGVSLCRDALSPQGVPHLIGDVDRMAVGPNAWLSGGNEGEGGGEYAWPPGQNEAGGEYASESGETASSLVQFVGP